MSFDFLFLLVSFFFRDTRLSFFPPFEIKVAIHIGTKVLVKFLLVIVVTSIVTSSELFCKLLKPLGVGLTKYYKENLNTVYGQTFRSCFFFKKNSFLPGHHSLQFPLFHFFLFLRSVTSCIAAMLHSQIVHFLPVTLSGKPARKSSDKPKYECCPFSFTRLSVKSSIYTHGTRKTKITFSRQMWTATTRGIWTCQAFSFAWPTAGVTGPETKQEQTLFKDLRRWWKTKFAGGEITYFSAKWMTTSLKELDPTLKRIRRTKVKKKLIELRIPHWRSEFIKPKYRMQ